ncbi:MAG: aminoglycoside phosphotransferase family protein [Thermomicrobiales bacterium]
MSAPVILRDGVTIPADIVTQLIARPDTRHSAEWFARLPAMIDRWCDEWHITLEPGLPRISYNIVLFGTSARSGPVVLKLSPPHEEFRAELEGLRLAQGDGVVRLLHGDAHEAGMLLERITPGVPLRDLDSVYDDIEATRIAATYMKRYWRHVSNAGDLIPLERWFRDLFTYEAWLSSGAVSSPLPVDLAQAAGSAARDMIGPGTDPILLHGDLHHDNLLTNQQGGWTIIDPKGLIGAREYEVGTWMLNTPWLRIERDLPDLLRRRVEVFSEELGLPRERVLAGGLVHAVLCACWSLIDADEATPEDDWLAASIASARIFHDLIAA